MPRLIPKHWRVPRMLVHRAVFLRSLCQGHAKCALRQKEGCERRGGQEGKSCLNADSGWQHTGWVVGLPCGFGSVLYKTGEVLHGFQKEEEEGFWHALIKGDFLDTRGTEGKGKRQHRAGEVWGSSGRIPGPGAVQGREERERNLSRLWVKRHVCPREWGHEGFLSRGGSWEEGRIRKDAKTHNAADCSTATLGEFGQILEL